MPEERELFTETYDTYPDTVWQAVKQALATMDLREADDDSRTARFTSGMSLTSWGENLIANVAPDGSRTVLTVSGRPKGSFLTTKWGEDQHARGVEKDLLGAVARQLAP
jgi:hypothetical protein